MQKLIASDLDGTLLRPGTILSTSTIQGIHALKAAGHAIVIASGRTFEEIKDICAPLMLESYEHAYWIGYNGVEALSAMLETVIHRVRFGWDVVKIVWKEVSALGMHMHVFTDRSVYLTKGIVDTLRIVKDGRNVETIDMDRFETDEPIMKIVVLDRTEKCDLLRATLSKDVLTKTSAFKSADMLVEFVPKGGTKGEALEVLAKRLNIAKKDIYAYGDEENDLTMILFAGHGIAMKNAKQMILDAASEITDSNEQDGVVKSLIKHGIIDEGGFFNGV
jgi:hypothetical protein